MKSKIVQLEFLFLFLVSITLTNCTSSEIEEEISQDDLITNELLKKDFKVYLLDKEKSDRPGNQ